MKLKLIIWLTILLPVLVKAQPRTSPDEQLAVQYFDQKEYDKALVYLDKLYDKNPDAWFTSYYKCLVELKEYSKAEKVIKKQIKRNPTATHLYVWLGKIYKLQNDPKKEEEQYQKAIKELIPEQNYIFPLAHAFEDEQLYDHAIEVYKKGRKAYADSYPFYYEIADVYKKKGDLKAMINEYLDAIEFRESELYTAQGNLQNSLGYDDKTGGFNNPLLKQELQKRIQQHPDKTVLSEFLIFIQTQQKDFEGAFVQCKALDKRRKEDGSRIMDLAKLCISNEDYSTAETCYQYVMSKGKDQPYYDVALIENINTQYLKLTSQASPAQQDVNTLQTAIDAAIKQYGVSNMTLPLIKKEALLKAYYQNSPGDAIDLLQNTIDHYGFDAKTLADIKLDLGDIMLLAGNIWDASLLYSQVEKDFKYEPIGQEAKFRNARLSYYAGDFNWAKTQADILKGATTKVIANDALDLSLVISDAIGVDTNDAPLRMFSSADLLILQHQYTRALARLDSINLMFATHTLGDDIYYRKADIYQKLGRYEEAVKMLQNITEFFPDEIYGDDALFKQAEIYERNLHDNEKAKALYEELLTKYPGSIYVAEARKRFRALRGDIIN
ncbi:MAG: tetratricopeptide repeat protein [Bacteroidetes bacterium]|nr:tetratricopeptide repeat protein [Bacteroidota bacterium]